MTPDEAVAAASAVAPRVTGCVLASFTSTDRVEVAKVAGMLAKAVGRVSGRVWPAEDVEALAEGIAGSRPPTGWALAVRRERPRDSGRS